jgi:hypothetical protein
MSQYRGIQIIVPSVIAKYPPLSDTAARVPSSIKLLPKWSIHAQIPGVTNSLSPILGHLTLSATRPIEPAPLTFDESVKEISPAFCDICEQAHKAEQFGLTEICGVPYRKSVEFLIKDYLIKTRPNDKIPSKPLCLAVHRKLRRGLSNQRNRQTRDVARQ